MHNINRYSALQDEEKRIVADEAMQEMISRKKKKPEKTKHRCNKNKISTKDLERETR